MEEMNHEPSNPSHPNGNPNHRPLQFHKTFNWTRLTAFSRHVIHDCGKIFVKPAWPEESPRLRAS